MPSEIQSVYAMKPKWTAQKLRSWLRKNNIKPIKSAHIIGNEIRYRINSPNYYYRFRTEKLSNGVYLVFGFF